MTEREVLDELGVLALIRPEDCAPLATVAEEFRVVASERVVERELPLTLLRPADVRTDVGEQCGDETLLIRRRDGRLLAGDAFRDGSGEALGVHDEVAQLLLCCACSL